jgi:hypothetical protein
MPEIDEPAEERIGNGDSAESTPSPGGEPDVSERTLPPYEDRSDGDAEVAAGVPRAMGSEEPLREPNEPGSDRPDEQDPENDRPPAGVGESVGRRGEDVADREGTEPGRQTTSESDDAGRPHGESSPRDRTGIHPHEDNESRPS